MIQVTTREAQSGTLTVAVIEALADAEGVDATELEYSLGEYIDTDALDVLGASLGNDWHLRFTVADRMVAVDGDGSIAIDGTEYQ